MKCIRCNKETIGHMLVCNECLDIWVEMRETIFNKLQEKYGKLSPSNHQTFIKETKRLEKIWRGNEEKFLEEINKIS